LYITEDNNDFINTNTLKTMKTNTIYMLFIGLFFIFQSNAQDCDNYQDCFSKGLNSNFTSDKKEYFEKALKLAKKEKVNPSRAYFELGVTYYKESSEYNTKPLKEAKKNFEKAIKEEPDYYWPYSWTIAMYQTKYKNYEDALKEADNAIKKFPDGAVAYYDRGHVHRYFNKVDLALADFKKAYDLLISGQNSHKDFSDKTMGDIPVWYVFMLQKKNGSNIYDSQMLDILKKAKEKTPKSPYLLGELALAYFDNNNFDMANQVTNEAMKLEPTSNPQDSYKTSNSGANFILAFNDFKNKNYKNSAFRAGTAFSNRNHPHPVVSYYRALTNFYYATDEGTDPNVWKNNEGLITNGFEIATKELKNTKYAHMGNEAQRLWDHIKNHKAEERKKANTITELDFKEFLINFNQMPNSYVLNYNTLQGRDITNLKASRVLFPYLQGSVNAIGKIAECESGHVFLVHFREFKSGSDLTTFAILKTDKNGNKVDYKNIVQTQKTNGYVALLGEFSLSINGSNYTFRTKNTYENGHIKTGTITGSCN